MIRWISLFTYLLTFDFMYVLPRCNNFENNWDKSIASIKICCWFKYAAVISVITTRDLSRSTIHMSVSRNVCENIQEIHYDVQRTCWRTVRMPDVEVLGHSGRNERAQNEITKRKLSVPGRRAYPTSRSSPFLIAPFAFSRRTTSQDRRIKARAQKKTV